MSSCPNCHNMVAPADDICENCGAVLSSTIVSPTFVAAPIVSSPVVPMPAASGPNLCPNCKQPVNSADDICDHCGMVLTSVTTPPTSVSVQSGLPAAPPLGVGGQDTWVGRVYPVRGSVEAVERT